ncbi:MAG: hydantoinase/oxoprolinase family protein [SAR202 cluster bacterium]|nr:hydantoinase/oxoprolinase family protein [SAR202 cluster bacterium]
MTTFRIGVDIGGTFTDLAASDPHGKIYVAKTMSTPADPSEGLLEGLAVLAERLGMSRRDLLASTSQIIHGTTVATNALLERKGARVGILTTAGHRDVLEMREGLKDDRYNLRLAPPEPLVPRARIFGIEERMRSDGTAEIPLGRPSIDRALGRLKSQDVQSVAICYLHSYRNDAHERATALAARAAFGRDVYISTSSEVLPQIKEFERFWTTVVNAYVGPVVGSYLARLQARLRQAGFKGKVLILQSHGGVAPVNESIRNAVGSVLSGPAGGVAGGQHAGRILGAGDLITFDMGGTSTDIALLKGGAPQLTSEKRLGVARIAVPSLDIHTLGAGGGSIARVQGGILRVGPESAGAAPGPACYGRGGTSPTVTDANLVLGLLDPDTFLGGRMRLDSAAAHGTLAALGKHLGTDPISAAEGVHRVVNTNMAEGIRIVSVRRGIDPRRFTLVSFGGAAGLHITEVARTLEIGRVVVPDVAPVLSAWGMLGSDVRYELVRSHVGEAGLLPARRLRSLLHRLEAEGRKRLGNHPGQIQVRRSLDMRYGEQIFEVEVPLEGVDPEAADLVEKAVERFHKRHDELFAYSAPGQEVVVVNVRVAVVGVLPGTPVAGESVDAVARSPRRTRKIYLGSWAIVPVHDHRSLIPGKRIDGPAIIESDMTTVLLRKGDRAKVTPQRWLDIGVG